MPTRATPPNGAPTWADLWTSDVAGSRRFYGELFGWESTDPQAEFGGYFTFSKDGVDVAGAMGDMGDMKADNRWKVYFATDDAEATLKAASAEGAQVLSGAMAVADLGVQSMLVDPSGAVFGTWQPGTFPGFTVLEEPGTPNWFELATRDHDRAVAFYRTVLGWEVAQTVTRGTQPPYTLLRPAEGGAPVAGVMDASGFLPEGAPPSWSVYWQVEDAAASVATVERLGGRTVMAPQASPYGTIAVVTDPSGAEFRFRSLPS
jgi:predicted enzyme related to lactoylglutathione lyase